METPVPPLPVRLPIIAIDGGAASGKSSTAQGVADQLGFLHVDTGAHYRELTRHLHAKGLIPQETPELVRFLDSLLLGTEIKGRSAFLRIDRETDPEELRSPEVNRMVSLYAALPAVRRKLLSYQRDQVRIAQGEGFGGVVMEGRDIGSVIFPESPFRYFLTADPAERARRRARDGQTDSISERDRIDSSRTTAPLHCPAGAIAIDTTHLSLAEVVRVVLDDYQTRGKR